MALPETEIARIAGLLKRHFKIQGTARIDPETGLVDVDGDCKFRMKTRNRMLPVKFGVVTGKFICRSKDLVSLEGCPRKVGKLFDAGNNNLTSLEGAPAHVGGDFFVRSCDITNLRGAPRSTGGNFVVMWCPLTSLEGLPQSVDNLLILSVDRNVGLLRVLMVDTPMEIELNGGEQVAAIINRYLPRGVNGVMPCATELHKAGYGGNAKL